MSKADPVIDWMLGEGRQTDHDMNAFGSALMNKLLVAGVPVARAFCGVRTLHPLVAATGYIWRPGQSRSEQRTASFDDAESDAFIKNPAFVTTETGEIFRNRLENSASSEFPILEELRAEGMTDYLAIPMTFSDGNRNPLSFQCNTPGGFHDADIEALQKIADVLSLVIESELRDRTARQVLDTYVGRRTGQLVLSGGIRRGFGETIEAVIWFSDLNGFTALTERLPRDELLEHLNTHFEIIVDAIDSFDGEVLKFLGDGLLAIFEVSETRSAPQCCTDAMAAMHAARQATEPARSASQNAADLDWSLALHIGEVSYGNIGAPDRLDFTVIGPTVNQAARLEALAGTMGEPVVMSKAFAETYGKPLRDLGAHPLKGVREHQQVFAPIL